LTSRRTLLSNQGGLREPPWARGGRGSGGGVLILFLAEFKILCWGGHTGGH
jgi:hypothetical protein